MTDTTAPRVELSRANQMPILYQAYRWSLVHSRQRGATFIERRLRPHVERKPLQFPVRVFGEYSMWVRSDDRNIEYCLWLRGAYGEHIGSIVRAVRNADQVIYDIGANVGLYSLLAAMPRHDRAHVYAFEPVPSTRVRLQANIELNDLTDAITVVPCGLGNARSEFEVSIAPDDCGRASLHHETGGNSERVTVMPLDDLFAEGTLRPPTFLKIDIEGHEWSAVQGASQVIQQHRPIILVECNPETCESAGWNFEELASQLEAWGYELWRVGEPRLRNDPEPAIRFPDVLALPSCQRPDCCLLRDLLADPDLSSARGIHCQPYRATHPAQSIA